MRNIGTETDHKIFKPFRNAAIVEIPYTFVSHVLANIATFVIQL